MLTPLASSVVLLWAVLPLTPIGQAKPDARPSIGRLQVRPTVMMARGPQGEILHVTTRFKAKMDFEASSLDVVPGEAYSIKVYLTNLGSESVDLTGMSVMTRINRSGEPEARAPLVSLLETGKRVLIAEIAGSWPEGLETWVARVDVASGEEHCSGRIALGRKR